MSDWKFDQTQSVALLETIPKIDGMKVLGTTKDRWGRDAVAFGVETSEEGGVFKTMLLFNPETGRLTNVRRGVPQGQGTPRAPPPTPPT